MTMERLTPLISSLQRLVSELEVGRFQPLDPLHGRLSLPGALALHNAWDLINNSCASQHHQPA